MVTDVANFYGLSRGPRRPPALLCCAGFLTLVLVALVAAPVIGAAAQPTVLEARIGVEPHQTRFVLELSEAVDFKLFSLDNPPRIVLDLPPVEWAIGEGASPGDGLIKRFRFGRFDPTTSRLVLDLSAPAAVVNSFLIPSGEGVARPRLVLDLAPVGAEEYGRIVAATPPAAPEPAVPVPAPKPEIHANKRLVVIDPGHGGVDPGAVGRDGAYEKIITLAAARELKVALEASGRYAVVLTRESDIFLPLRERVEIGRRTQAELFISLHADSHDSDDLRGVSVYTLSERASDEEAAQLAQRENRSDVIAGLDLTADYDDEVAAILVTLAQRETMNCSATFATLLVPELGKKVTLLNKPHRSAGFRVLKAPDMPSILVEMGYLSNPTDEAMLRSKEGRGPLIEGIVAAVDRFFAKKQCWT